MSDLPKWFSREWLEKASLEQRHTSWRNAREKGGPEGTALAEAIQGSGLPYTPRGYLTLDDPRVLQIYDIVNSSEGHRKCVAALRAGFPALAGVDGDIQAALGPDYCSENGTTMTAGDFVAAMMRSKGYVDAGQRKMPNGSTAKTALFFEERRRSI